jgi:hypothetical protein
VRLAPPLAASPPQAGALPSTKGLWSRPIIARNTNMRGQNCDGADSQTQLRSRLSVAVLAQGDAGSPLRLPKFLDSCDRTAVRRAEADRSALDRLSRVLAESKFPQTLYGHRERLKLRDYLGVIVLSTAASGPR